MAMRMPRAALAVCLLCCTVCTPAASSLLRRAGTTARDGGGAPAGDLARKLEELPTHSLPRAFDAVIKLRQEAVEAYVLEHGLSTRQPEVIQEMLASLLALNGTVFPLPYDAGARIVVEITRYLQLNKWVGFAARLSPAAIKYALNITAIEFLEEDVPVALAYPSTTGINGLPWGLDRIDQRGRNLDGVFTPGGTGEGVDVYIVDTGVGAGHAEFESRVDTTRGVNVYYDRPATDTRDCNGHGSHVAGIVAGRTVGVAKQATIVPIRVYSCASETSVANIVSGLQAVYDRMQLTSRRAVINLSLAAANRIRVIDSMVEMLITNNGVVVVAAGNAGDDACSYSPGAVPNAITVGATAQGDELASYSNYGSCVDIVAPGSDVLSVAANSDTAGVIMSGTSMAAPHVAGTAAVILSAEPMLTPAQVTKVLLCLATDDGLTGDARGTTSKLLYAPVENLRAAIGDCLQNRALQYYADAQPSPAPATNTITCKNDCSGHGICIGQDVCRCSCGWTGAACETSMGVLPLPALLVAAVVHGGKSVRVASNLTTEDRVNYYGQPSPDLLMSFDIPMNAVNVTFSTCQPYTNVDTVLTVLARCFRGGVSTLQELGVISMSDDVSQERSCSTVVVKNPGPGTLYLHAEAVSNVQGNIGVSAVTYIQATRTLSNAAAPHAASVGQLALTLMLSAALTLLCNVL